MKIVLTPPVTVKKSKTGAYTDKERKLRQEASRLSSLANKRLKRMEKQDLTNSPAYQKWLDEGGQKFGVKGKSMQQVKYEVTRLNNFINLTTSTVTGAKNYFNNVAKQVGITTWENYKDLQNKLNTFFSISSKVKDYLYNSKEIGVAIGYQKIWEIVSDYVEEIDTGLDDIENSIEEIADLVIEGVGYGKMDDILDDWLNDLI